MKIKELFEKDEPITLENYLIKCGVENVEEYLNPSGKYLEPPMLYDNMQEAINLTKYHINLCSIIGIVVDVDFDGYGSASILYKELKLLYPNCVIKLFLHDDRKIHGLTDEIMFDKILHSGVELLFTPDSSSSDFKQHKILKEHNIYHIALDHHPFIPQDTPSIIVNNQISDRVKNKCGSGGLVTFKFCQRLEQEYNKNYTKDMVDLCYASLVSDIMDMSNIENAVFRKFGSHIHNKMLVALCGKYNKGIVDVTNEQMSWNIVPKLSAIIRSQREDVKQSLLMALITEQDNYIQYVMDNVDDIHKEQKKIVENYYKEYLQNVNGDNNIIFEPIDIYPFYTGLVGSKLVNQFNKPTILYRKNKSGYIGSVRSPIDIKQPLIDSELFTFASGHDKSCGCGFTSDNIDKIKDFVKNFKVDSSEKVVQSYLTDKIPNDLFSLTSDYDYVWGNGLPKPTFHIHSIHINSSQIRELGNGLTIKFTYQGVDFIHFFTSNKLKEELYMDKPTKIVLNVIGTLGWNIWKDKKTKQVIMDKIECVKDKELSFDDLF